MQKIQEIVTIGGAGCTTAGTVWPIQTLRDKTIYPIEYSRGFNHRETRDPAKSVIAHYGERVFQQIKNFDQPVDLYGHSMGALVGLEVIRLADKQEPGLVRNLIAINPGIFHGPPKHNFHLTLEYVWKLLFPDYAGAQAVRAAIQKIEAEIPNLKHQIDEDCSAIRESGDGVVMIPRGLNRSERIKIYYCPEDEVIPEEITLHLASRIGVKAKPVPGGYGHKLPLLDTEGVVLNKIRSENP